MSRILLQTGFHTVQHSLLRVMVMMIGELDFGSIFIDSIDEYRNDKKERPLNPFPQVGFFFIFLCLILLAVALMNLLVRKFDSISFRLHNRLSFWSATLPIFVKSMFFFCYHMCICVVVALIQELISFGCQMKRKIMKLADHKEEKKIQLYLR